MVGAQECGLEQIKSVSAGSFTCSRVYVSLAPEFAKLYVKLLFILYEMWI
jgi:hypothetical protein